jgi:hypothetical protein
MARKTKTDVEEYDDNGEVVEYDDLHEEGLADGELSEDDALAQLSVDPDTETVTAETADGEDVEIAISEQARNEAALIRGQVTGEGDVATEQDFPGKEEDAELAREQHELGIDNQLIDPND